MSSRILPLALASYVAAGAQTFPLATMEGLTLHKVSAQPATYNGRKAIRVTPPAAGAASDEHLVFVPVTDFQNGTIEVDVAGKPAAAAAQAARGFIGVAFRTADNTKYECFYLRPTNGRADDQVRRNHSAQYVSHPDFPWPRLRKEEPEKYESYVDLVPGEWTKVRITVQAAQARLYVHGNEQPTLVVNDLKKGQSKGGVALWIGPGTEGYFSNLKITRQ